MSSMTSAERLALAYLNKNKWLGEARSELKPGRYDVDVTVRVKGSLEINKDTEVAPTVKFDTQGMLLLMINEPDRFSGLSGADLLSALNEAAGNLSTEEKKRLMAATAYTDAEAAYKAEVIERIGKSPRKGSVKAKLDLLPPGGERAHNPSAPPSSDGLIDLLE